MLFSGTITHSIAIIQALDLDIVVSALPISIVSTENACDIDQAIAAYIPSKYVFKNALKFVNVSNFRTFEAALSNILKLSASTGVVFPEAANCFVPSVPSVSSPVFVPLFTHVISTIPATVISLSGNVYVRAAVVAFVKKFVNVFAAFLKLILKRVSHAYPPVVSFQDVSCLSVLRFAKFVFVCDRNRVAVIQSRSVVIADIFYDGIVRQISTGLTSQAISPESFQYFPVSVQVMRSFHIPVIIGATVFATPPPVGRPVRVVVGMVLHVRVAIISMLGNLPHYRIQKLQ
jgi:hypothetical protein